MLTGSVSGDQTNMMPDAPPTSAPAPNTSRWQWRRWGREAGAVWRGGWQRLWPRFWIIFLACGVGAVLVLAAGPTDNTLLTELRRPDNHSLNELAGFLSRYGDLTFGAPLAVLIWCVGVVRNKVRWRKLGLACLMAGLMGGLIVNVFRIGTGRPRPRAAEPYGKLVDGFYGPKPWKGKYQSFPSGHACVSSTTASTLGAVSPLLILPGAVYAGSVIWSRMQLNAHHPLDVTVGATIGTVCGLCYASTVPGAFIRLRRRRRRRPKRSQSGKPG